MYKSIKSFLDTRKQSDKLKSEIEQRAKELKQKSQNQLGYRVGQIDPKKQEELALRIAKAQKIKDPFIEKVENIKVFEIFPNKLAEIKSRNFYQNINRNSEDKIKDFSTPINDLMPPTSKEYSEDIKDKIKNVLNRTSEAQKDILKNHSLISDLNYILSVDKNHYLPKGKPDEKVYKNSRVYKSSDSFQIMKFGKPNLKFTINKWLVKIGLSKKNLIELKKKIIINLQTKLYFPITKFSKYLEKRIFLSKLTEKQKENLKLLNYPKDDINESSKLFQLIVFKNFDFTSVKKASDKLNNRENEWYYNSPKVKTPKEIIDKQRQMIGDQKKIIEDQKKLSKKLSSFNLFDDNNSLLFE